MERHLDLLLKDYELARGDDRNWFPLVGAMVAMLVTAVGALAVGLQSSALSCLTENAHGMPTDSSTCGLGRDFAAAILPIAPLAGLGLIALVSLLASVRGRYMLELEREIRALDDPGRPGLRWIELSQEVTSTKRGQTVYRAIVGGLFIGISLIYSFLLIYLAIYVDRWAQTFMTGVYLLSSSILFGALLKTWWGSEGLWDEVVRRRGEPAAVGPRRELPDRTVPVPCEHFVIYLLFPRPVAIVLRLVPLLAAVLGYGWSAHFQGIKYPNGRSVVLAVALCVSLEWGFAAARDHWTDLRRDERLPRSWSLANHKTNIYTTVVVLLGRVLLPFLWLVILLPGELEAAAFVAGLLVASCVGDSLIDAVEFDAPVRRWWTRSGEILFRGVAFFARGIAVWKIVSLLWGAPGRAEGATIALSFALLGVVWSAYEQHDARQQRRAGGGRAERQMTRVGHRALGHLRAVVVVPSAWIVRVLGGAAVAAIRQPRPHGEAKPVEGVDTAPVPPPAD